MNAFLLMQKRLLSRPSFLVVLLLLPLLVGVIRLGTTGESGIVTVAVYTGASDLGREVRQKLKTYGGALRYLDTESEEAARQAVISYRADMAWSLPQDLEEELYAFASDGFVDPVIDVYAREDTVALHFAMEILEGTLYPYIAYDVYREKVLEDLGLSGYTEKDLRETYERARMEGTLFRSMTPDHMETKETGILLAPLRGMAALWLMICTVAAQLYAMEDEKKKLFAGKAKARAFSYKILYQIVYGLDGLLIFWATLLISGLWTRTGRELLCGFLLTGCGLIFANLLRLLCGNREAVFCGAAVLLFFAMLILCPVFLSLSGMEPVQVLLPPYHYLRGIYSLADARNMVIYLATGICLLSGLAWIRKSWPGYGN